MVLPLSAHVIMALLSLSLVWMDLIILASGYVLWVGLCSSNVLTQSAASFL